MSLSDTWQQELAERRASVWSIVEDHECDTCLIFGGQGHAEPFRYLTNFVPVLGDAWGVMAAPDQMVCVLNFDWQLEEARQRSGIDRWHGVFNSPPIVVDVLSEVAARKAAVVGLHRLPVLAYHVIQASLPEVTWVDIGEEVAALRRRKSPLEVELLREAGRITDAALDAVREELRPGVTEHELVAKLGYAINSMGGQLAFPPVVISGNQEPIPIRQPTSRRIQVGDTVMIDLGAEYEGYQADASRTFVLGETSPEQERVWDTVRRAYEAALSFTRPGVPCYQLHRAAADVIESAGYRLVHRIGHGIGLATSFEWPSLDSETALLAPGMTICIEPGIYISGAGNMKLEDDVVITEDGFELLTSSSSELVVPVG